MTRPLTQQDFDNMDHQNEDGRSPLCGSGSQASPGAATASPPPVSIPNAVLCEALEQAATWLEDYAAQHYAEAKTAPSFAEQHGRETRGKTNAALAKAHAPASGIEAPSGDETGTGSAEGESPAPEGGDAR
jgi:hypothetical protein